MNKHLPRYDRQGLHILDPNDRLGLKSRYITLLQDMALQRHLPQGDGTQIGLDLGCGYGRLTAAIARRGWRAVGIDPDRALLTAAHRLNPQLDYFQGALPNLPLAAESVGLMVMQNLMRVFWLLGCMDCAEGVSRYLCRGGHLVVVDNLWPGNPHFIPETRLVSIFEHQGLALERRVPLRAARWWMTYLIRYGLVPRCALPTVAEYELARREKAQAQSRWQYFNVLFLFRKP